jgi:PAS domain S-box-containing protein
VSVAEPLIQATLIGEAVDNGPLAIFVADENGRYVAVNTAACELLGYTRAELLELTAHDLAPGEPVAVQLDELERKGSLSGTSVLRHKDASELAVEWHAARTTVAGMEFFVSFARPL